MDGDEEVRWCWMWDSESSVILITHHAGRGECLGWGGPQGNIIRPEIIRLIGFVSRWTAKSWTLGNWRNWTSKRRFWRMIYTQRAKVRREIIHLSLTDSCGVQVWSCCCLYVYGILSNIWRHSCDRCVHDSIYILYHIKILGSLNMDLICCSCSLCSKHPNVGFYDTVWGQSGRCHIKSIMMRCQIENLKLSNISNCLISWQHWLSGPCWEWGV